VIDQRKEGSYKVVLRWDKEKNDRLRKPPRSYRRDDMSSKFLFRKKGEGHKRIHI